MNRSTQRMPLNKERVLRAAIALADAEGIEALSMRRLGKELGVEAMSLYNHVANKEALLDGIVDLVSGEIELPSEEVEWKTAMGRCAVSARDAFLRHRWTLGLWTSARAVGPGRFAYMDWMLKTMRSAGFSGELAYHAFHILEGYIFGFALQQLNFSAMGGVTSAVATFLEHFRPEMYPYLAEHIDQHQDPPVLEQGGFEMGLDLILEGLERLRDSFASR